MIRNNNEAIEYLFNSLNLKPLLMTNIVFITTKTIVTIVPIIELILIDKLSGKNT